MQKSNVLRLPRRPSARQRRVMLEAALERLLSVVEAVVADLDGLDDDPDLEPSLGFLERPCSWARASGDQRDALQGLQGDLEDEHDGREEGEDDEPTQGSCESLDQRGWADGNRDEREHCCEDEGAQCEDEGWDSDSEPEANCTGMHRPIYADGGHDQTRVKLPHRPVGASVWTKVG